MQDQAYNAMRRLQTHHWWWRGMRRVYAGALRRFAPRNTPRRVIDVGCGYGANLGVLALQGQLVGVDLEFEALQAIRERPALGVVQARADALPFRSNTFDVIGLLALIEHVEDDEQALREAWRVAQPGAIMLVLTSALAILWSHHDVANNHYRRYRLSQLRDRLHNAGWSVLHVSYINALIFPAVLATRLIQRLFKPTSTAQYDMGPSRGFIGRLLEVVLAAEGALITRWGWRLPLGVDLFGIARRDD